MAATDRGFTVQLGADWEVLAKMHVRVPRPWARMGLKPEDLGFLTWLLSHKPNQPLSAKFAAQGLSCSPDRVEAICKRLEARDILIRRRERDDAGRLRGAIWELIPPPEFRELARALAAAQGEPEPEFPGLASTSENIPSREVKQQVNTNPEKTRSGKTRSGKSGTKIVQEKGNSGESTHHHRAVEPEVPSGGGVPRADLSVLQEVLRSDAYEALTLDERHVLAVTVEQLLSTGWTTAAIRARKPDRRVNAGTTHPATHIGRALDTLAAEAAPGTTAPSPRRSSAADCDRCDPNGLIEVADGTQDGRLMRCPHDGSIPAAPAPESESDPARVAEARAAFAALAEGMSAA